MRLEGNIRIIAMEKEVEKFKNNTQVSIWHLLTASPIWVTLEYVMGDPIPNNLFLHKLPSLGRGS